MRLSQILALLTCSILAASAGVCRANLTPIPRLHDARLPKPQRVGMTLQQVKACFTPDEFLGSLGNMRHGAAIFVRDGVTTRVEWRRIDGQSIVTKWEVLGSP
jgi:hypothetical protein